MVKAESGSGKNPNFQPLDLVALCKQVTIEWVPLALGKEIDLGYAGAQTPAMIHGDALLLGEMLGNLIDNAIRYSQHGGYVTVRLQVQNQQAVLDVEDIGPGMGVFSRHARVLEDDDSTMTVKTALAIINRIWGEIENEGDTSLDAETQVALAWFGSYGFDAKSSGELITLANAKNIPTATLFKSDVFEDLSGKAGLKPRERLSSDWTPAGDASLTIWECVQHTARALSAENGGDAAAARLIAQMGSKAADARSLAYRLFQIATDKGWAAEALVYNELAAEWPRLEALAEGIGSAISEAKGKLQYDLL